MQTVEEENYRSVCELVSNLRFGTVSYICTHNNKLLAYVQVTLFPCVGFFFGFLIGIESAPILLVQCRFHGLAICDAKILI